MKKGFTLIELLAVLIILAILSIIAFPTVNNIIENSKNTILQKQINTILNAAYDLSLKNMNYLPNDGEVKYIPLATLKVEGLVDSNIKNPNTGELFEDHLVISIKKDPTATKLVKDNINYSKKESNYLYTVEINKVGEKQPQIELINLTKNDNLGIYIEILDLNTSYEAAQVKIKNSDNEEVQLDVIVNITNQNYEKAVIDTSKMGIYNVIYTVVNSEGYSNSVTRKIIISDSEPPTITVPDETYLSSDITSYNLNSDVTCEDNSGICNITCALEEGTKGVYTRICEAQDYVGNTVSASGTIIIE